MFSAQCHCTAAFWGEHCILSTELSSEGSMPSHKGELQSFTFSEAAASIPVEFTANTVVQASLETFGLCLTEKRLSQLRWLKVTFCSANKCGKAFQKPPKWFLLPLCKQCFLCHQGSRDLTSNVHSLSKKYMRNTFNPVEDSHPWLTFQKKGDKNFFIPWSVRQNTAECNEKGLEFPSHPSK